MIGGSKLVNDGYKPPENMENGSDCVNLKGIYDIKEERCKLAEERGIHAYHSFEEVLADPEVDILTLAVPNDCHKDLAIPRYGCRQTCHQRKAGYPQQC